MHCLVLRGAAGTVIRRLAADTRLNGRAFRDARLVPGDCLSVGPIEFEVLDADPLPDRRPASRSRQREPQRDLDRRAESLDRRLQELDALAGRLSHREHSLEQRQEALDEQQRTFRQQQEALAEQAEALRRQQEAASERERALRRQQEALAELEAQREALQQDRTRWENERAEAKRQLAAQAEEIDALRRTLDAQRQDLQDARDRWTVEHDEARNKLQAESAELEPRRAEVDASRAESESRRADVETRHAELEARQATMDARQAEFEARCAELDARQAELDDRESEIDEKCRRWEAARAAADVGPEQPSGGADPEEDVQFEEPSQGAPESSEEVLRRLGIAPSFDHEEEEDEREKPGGRSLHAAETFQRASEAPHASRPAAEEEDESIDDYMARLLDRVRTGTGGSGGPTAHVPPVPAAPASSPSSPPASKADDSPPQAPTAKTGEQGEMSPRAVAPERSVNLIAMRDLANQSARAAIDQHARRRLLGQTANKLLVALVALATGAILLWVWWAKTHDQVTMYGAVACLVVALAWLGQYVVLGGHMLLKRPGREKADRKDDEGEADAAG